MKSAIVAAALAATAAALPAPQSSTSKPTRFGGMALRSASPIHFGQINANGQQFWIGKATATYCPEDSAASSACATASKDSTIFSQLNGQKTLGLDTIVPGGQTIYVTEGDEAEGVPAGLLKFTQAHSTATSGTPIYEGFSISDDSLQFEGNDWLACPAAESDTEYEIFAASRVGEACEECLGFSWSVVELDDSTAAAWQYTK